MADTGTPAAPDRVGRDLGTGALVVAAVLAAVALLTPVATTRATGPAGTATSGWFGDLVVTDGAGARTVSSGAVPAFGWTVLVGLGLLVVAVVLRLRTGRAPATALLAAGWLAASGVLVVLHTAARAARLRDVLAPVVPGPVELTGSVSPWLLVAAGVLAAAAALAPPRQRPPPRPPAPPLAVWEPAPR